MFWNSWIFLYKNKSSKCYPYHTQFAKINLKWIIELNVKAKYVKLTKGNRGETPGDIKTVNIS